MIKKMTKERNIYIYIYKRQKVIDNLKWIIIV